MILIWWVSTTDRFHRTCIWYLRNSLLSWCGLTPLWLSGWDDQREGWRACLGPQSQGTAEQMPSGPHRACWTPTWIPEPASNRGQCFIVRRVLFHHLEFPWPTSWKFDVILMGAPDKLWGRYRKHHNVLLFNSLKPNDACAYILNYTHKNLNFEL